MTKSDKGIVASGHTLVSKAGAEILKAGGNAFDAIISAGFTSCVVEPTLNNLGGGGFLLSHDSRTNENIFFDFFVDTPGRGGSHQGEELHFFPVTVNFLGADQIFNVGLGSVAVPGVLKGLLHVHRRLGRMGLKDVLAHAIEHAKCHTVSEQQARFMKILSPIMTLTDTGRKLYQSNGTFIKPGDQLCNGELVAFLESLLHDGEEEFYRGEIARGVHLDMQDGEGLLTYDDLAGYQVYERAPLSLPYAHYTMLTAPEPSLGGALIGLSLSLLSKLNLPREQWGTKEYLNSMCLLMQEVNSLRSAGVDTPEKVLSYLGQPDNIAESLSRVRLFSRGTTHLSVCDTEGNCASMTCSNGEGSGYFSPATGVMLNNMMGEDDLHPDGFHAGPPGERVCSMMSPTLLLDDQTVKLVIGSGGSKRITTAISQVIHQVIHYQRGLQEAVDAPRLYLDEQTLQAEPGFTAAAFDEIIDEITVNIWDDKDIYFGGVHAVIPGEQGAGDARRGGAVETV